MARTIDVVSLYPKDMNIYGDSGNVLTIRRRLELYGYEPVVHQYNQGDDWPDQVDLILGGGGQDTGQKKIIDDFYHRADLLRSLAADGTPMLMICGLYQLFGEHFDTVDGTRRVHDVIGTYMHGSLLPKNPAISDFLIETAVTRRYGTFDTSDQTPEQAKELARLDQVATNARKAAAERPR